MATIMRNELKQNSETCVIFIILCCVHSNKGSVN